MQQIEKHLEAAYPNEGAGFMLGHQNGDALTVESIMLLENQREAEAQHNRFELSTEDFMQAELRAAQLGMSFIGVFHSHPDHPAQPSEFDREHALPNFSYLITTVTSDQATVTRAWRLRGDRSAFDEDQINVTDTTGGI
jgi:proteasome lid subunit RPN8/RPN11